MGKTPLLPIFAALLGASDVLLGLIVSVSTVTGMLAKPLIGLLSDRWGRKLWLLIGTMFFGLIPFAYWGVDSAESLVIIRIIHGMATAIYGPVTLAYVAERASSQRAEKLGWFSNARSVGYIIGPAAGGFLLLWLSPQMVFTLIGLVSCAAFIPILQLNDSEILTIQQRPIRQQLAEAWQSSSQSGAVWLSGGIEALSYVVLYALKAFLPIYALTIGYNSAEIGLFFAVQEGANILAKPFGGRMADRWGKRPMIGLGLLLLAAVLPLILAAQAGWQLLVLACLLGLGQSVLFPATLALVAEQIDSNNLGAGMGFIGTLRNAGKVAGPILGGFLIARLDYAATFWLMSGLLALCSLGLMLWQRTEPMAVAQAAGD